jgi:hypothetical protein
VGLAVQRKDRREQGLDRRLAVRAGDADDARTALRAHGAGQVAEREHRVGNDDLRQIDRDRSFDQRRGRAGGLRCRDELVRVEMLAFERDEQRARLRTACVAEYAAHVDIGAA